jgi:thiol-disulfide isomerase/thioredoxin|tara:strand:+ start:3851 stop:4312 length:462 start_codon:yes stop_codon:yes gene_type:complete
MMRSILTVALLTILFSQGVSASPDLDWNDSQIRWHDYQSGLAESRRSGRPALVLLYADWCPTCHTYQKLFSNPQIVRLAQQVVMIRVNAPEQPGLSNQFADDGAYLPRTYAIDPSGRRVEVISRHPQFRHFYEATDVAGFSNLLRRVIALSGE